MRPIRINPTVRTIVSVAIVAAFVGVWGWKTVAQLQINPVTYAVVVAFALAAGYGIWGRAFGEAVDEARELTGTQQEDDGDDE